MKISESLLTKMIRYKNGRSELLKELVSVKGLEA